MNSNPVEWLTESTKWLMFFLSIGMDIWLQNDNLFEIIMGSFLLMVNMIIRLMKILILMVLIIMMNFFVWMVLFHVYLFQSSWDILLYRSSLSNFLLFLSCPLDFFSFLLCFFSGLHCFYSLLFPFLSNSCLLFGFSFLFLLYKAQIFVDVSLKLESMLINQD